MRLTRNGISLHLFISIYLFTFGRTWNLSLCRLQLLNVNNGSQHFRQFSMTTVKEENKERKNYIYIYVCIPEQSIFGVYGLAENVQLYSSIHEMRTWNAMNAENGKVMKLELKIRIRRGALPFKIFYQCALLYLCDCCCLCFLLCSLMYRSFACALSIKHKAFIALPVISLLTN